MAARRKPGRIAGVTRALASDILHGRSASGSALPNEPLLGERFDVSRSVVREAVKTLAAKGLVTVAPRRGTRVERRENWNVLDRDVLDWMLADDEQATQDTIAALLEVREIIECAAARLAALRASLEDCAAIRQAYQDMIAGKDNSDAAVEADKRFHFAILAATGNPLMAGFAPVLETVLNRLFPLSIEEISWFELNLGRHGEVVEAICRHDPAGAEEAMRSVLNYTRGNVSVRKAPSRR